MAPKRLLQNSPSASSSSGEEEEEEEDEQEVAREDNPAVDSDSDSDSDSESETESDNTVSAFKIIPRLIPEPEKSGDAPKVIVAAADETPKKKNKKVKADRGKTPVVFSKKPDRKSSDLSKKKVNNNALAYTADVADVEMAEPSEEPTFRILLGLPSKRALEQQQKGKKLGKEKGKVVGDDKIVASSKRSKGKKEVAADGPEKEHELGNKTESLKGKKKVEAVGDEKKKEDLSFIGDGKGVWWEDLSMIGSDKAEELKAKWKQLKADELEVFILKNTLLKENAIAVIDAMKASRS